MLYLFPVPHPTLSFLRKKGNNTYLLSSKEAFLLIQKGPQPFLLCFSGFSFYLTMTMLGQASWEKFAELSGAALPLRSPLHHALIGSHLQATFASTLYTFPLLLAHS